MSTPSTSSPAPSGAIAGSVLPLRRAEELIATLSGVLSVRIVPSETGAVDEIHVLTTNEIVPKHMVRNIESALMAQLGLRVNHRKVSIATSLDPVRAADTPAAAYVAAQAAPYSAPQGAGAGEARPQTAGVQGQKAYAAGAIPGVASPAYGQPPFAGATAGMAESATGSAAVADTLVLGRRVLMFEDVEIRRSRSRGALCRVTLSKDGQEYIGEAEGQESPRARVDIAAQAAIIAILESMQATPGSNRSLALEGSKQIDAFDREFIFVSIVARSGRDVVALTGSCEVRESPETSAVLAVLDATNRWIYLNR